MSHLATQLAKQKWRERLNGVSGRTYIYLEAQVVGDSPRQTDPLAGDKDGRVYVSKDCLVSNSTISNVSEVGAGVSFKTVSCWSVATSALVSVCVVIAALVLLFGVFNIGGRQTSEGIIPPNIGQSQHQSMAKPWSNFNLDQDKFVPGNYYIPWTASGDDGGFVATNRSCFIILRDGLYSTRTKVTFMFESMNGSTTGVYHNMYWRSGTDTVMLEQNKISLPLNLPPVFYERSVLTNYGSYQAGDQICVMVSNTLYVYRSKVENKVSFMYRGQS